MEYIINYWKNKIPLKMENNKFEFIVNKYLWEEFTEFFLEVLKKFLKKHDNVDENFIKYFNRYCKKIRIDDNNSFETTQISITLKEDWKTKVEHFKTNQLNNIIESSFEISKRLMTWALLTLLMAPILSDFIPHNIQEVNDENEVIEKQINFQSSNLLIKNWKIQIKNFWKWKIDFSWMENSIWDEWWLWENEMKQVGIFLKKLFWIKKYKSIDLFWKNYEIKYIE